MYADIDVFFFWTGNEATVTVRQDGWQYIVKALEEEAYQLSEIVPEVTLVLNQARGDWFEKNRESSDPDALRAGEVSGSAHGSAAISEEQFERLKQFRQSTCLA
jgi:hypothetical protein